MVVLYYVNTYYLDAALETIQSLKKVVDLHVVIEISPESKKTNIIDIDDLTNYNYIEPIENVLSNSNYNQIKRYFTGILSVQFLIFKHRKSFSYASFKTAFKFNQYLNNIKPDCVHFDSVSPRIVGLLPFLFNTKVFITVHDPLPHSGEGSWKIQLTEFLYFKFARGLFFYSHFACDQFSATHSNVYSKKQIINFQPFTYIQQFSSHKETEESAILFFGRILHYKGVDLLLNAIPIILKKYPFQKFIIAGESINCALDVSFLSNYASNITYIDSYISTDLLASLIAHSKFVVCPYRDATQSGVLMTSNALGKIVLGTNVGAFPEYIFDNINGILMEPNHLSIANKIIQALDNNFYKDLEKLVNSNHSSELSLINQQRLLATYL